MKYSTYLVILLHICIHCKFLNARFECNDIVIFIYVHYPLDQNAIAFDTKGKTCNIKCLFRSLLFSDSDRKADLFQGHRSDHFSHVSSRV